MARFQNSKFQPSTLVVNDSHPGTPIAAYSREDRVQFSVFYFDRQKILQEITSQDGVKWAVGSIGQLKLTSDAPSDLTVEYINACRGAGFAWLVFHTGENDQTKLVYWNESTNTWSQVGGFSGVKPGAGFSGQSDGDAWRFYYVSSITSQLSQMICPSCCKKSGSPAWIPGIEGPKIDSASGGITVVTAGSPRFIYYQDTDGTVREIKNTGKHPSEAYQVASESSRDGNTKTARFKNIQKGEPGSAIAKVVPNSKMAVATGFRGSTAQMWLFAQWNETSISLMVRELDDVGGWNSPIEIPVGR